MAKKCARTFSIVVEKGKKSILDVRHLLPDALPRSVRTDSRALAQVGGPGWSARTRTRAFDARDRISATTTPNISNNSSAAADLLLSAPSHCAPT